MIFYIFKILVVKGAVARAMRKSETAEKFTSAQPI
jgi:hypothetical protein